jgi:hypothetical protein
VLRGQPVFQYDKLRPNGNGRSIGPKQTIQGLICQISTNALIQTQQGRFETYLTARVIYQDVFGSKEHVTEWCEQITDIGGDLTDPTNHSSYTILASGACKPHNCSDEECMQHE